MLINLLLPEQKRELRAARLNVVLLRYTLLSVGAVIFMLGILGVGFVITMYAQNNAKAELAEYEQVAAQYGDVKKQAEAFESNLATADKILSNEIIFSELMVEVAKSLPPGIIFSNLNVTTESFGEATTISARTKTYDGALQLKSTLEESNLFEDVSIVDISRSSSESELTGVAAEYPFTSTLNVTLSKLSTGGQR